jgi:YVTN family beta-propeller protein
VTFSPDGTHAYVAVAGTARVAVIDTASHTVVDTIVVDFSPESVAVSPDGTHLYVTVGREVVSVIDTNTKTVVATIIDDADPDGVAVSPDGAHVYITNNDNTVKVVTLGATPISQEPGVDDLAVLPGRLESVRYNDDGTRAYVITEVPAPEGGLNLSTTLAIIDTATDTRLGTPLTVSGNLDSLEFNPNQTRALLITSGPQGTQLAIIDTATTTRIGQPIQLDTAPTQPAILSTDNTHAIIVTTDQDNQGRTTTTLTTINLGIGPDASIGV